MIATGTPCCRPTRHFVAWHCQTPWTPPSAASGVVELFPYAANSEYEIAAKIFRGAFSTPPPGNHYWSTAFAVRRRLGDADDVRVAAKFAGPSIDVLPDIRPEWFDPPFASDALLGWTVFDRAGDEWNLRHRDIGGWLPGIEFDRVDFRPIDYWRVDAVGQVTPTADFMLQRDELRGADVELIIETPIGDLSAILEFVSETWLEAGTVYLFRWAGEYTATLFPFDELGPQPESVELSVRFSGCGAPADATVAVTSPAFGLGVGAPTPQAFAAAAVSQWTPSAGWTEFAFRGIGLPTQGVVLGALAYSYPLSWSAFDTPILFDESDAGIGVRGLNWASRGVATYDVCRVKILRLP